MAANELDDFLVSGGNHHIMEGAGYIPPNTEVNPCISMGAISYWVCPDFLERKEIT